MLVLQGILVPRGSGQLVLGRQAVSFPLVSSVLPRLVQVAAGSLPERGLVATGTEACALGQRPHALSMGPGPSLTLDQARPSTGLLAPVCREAITWAQLARPPDGSVTLGHPASVLPRASTYRPNTVGAQRHVSKRD